MSEFFSAVIITVSVLAGIFSAKHYIKKLASYDSSNKKHNSLYENLNEVKNERCYNRRK